MFLACYTAVDKVAYNYYIIDMDFAKFLKNYRKKNKLTLEQLTGKIPGATIGAVKRWLQGSRIPKEYSITGIKHYLGTK